MKLLFKTQFSVLFVLLVASFFTSCEDSQEDLQQNEKLLLEQYIADNSITTPAKASGLYYLENEEGTGAEANTGAYIMIKYSSRLLKGNAAMESNMEARFKYGVGQAITGIDEGISYMKEGGTAEMIIPSDLAFGNNEVGNIPPYSTLIYNVELTTIDLPVYEQQLLDGYIVENQITETPTATGLYYIENNTGTGDLPEDGETVYVNYTGYFLDGTRFSASQGAPFSFTLGQGQVIPGWDEGIALMKKGGTARLILPYSIAYGTEGYGSIPPCKSLIFDVELLLMK